MEAPVFLGDFLTADAWKYTLLIAWEGGPIIADGAATISFCSRSRGIRLATHATGAR
jgi:hypothetical protein